jgi:hypothetical protein
MIITFEKGHVELPDIWVIAGENIPEEKKQELNNGMVDLFSGFRSVVDCMMTVAIQSAKNGIDYNDFLDEINAIFQAFEVRLKARCMEQIDKNERKENEQPIK